MKYTFFILLTTGMYFSLVECALVPDMNLEGSLLRNNDTKILQLIYTTDSAVQLCTVEFLIDNRTHEDMRYFGSNCYHTMGICSPTVCKCSDDCMSFTLNVTLTENMTNHLCSCESRIEKNGIMYMTTISGTHDGNGGLKLYKKTVVPYRSFISTQKATTFSPEISTVSSISVPLTLAGTVFGLLGLACLLLLINLLMKCSRYCKSTPGSPGKVTSSRPISLLSSTYFPAEGDMDEVKEIVSGGLDSYDEKEDEKIEAELALVLKEKELIKKKMRSQNLKEQLKREKAELEELKKHDEAVGGMDKGKKGDKKEKEKRSQKKKESASPTLECSERKDTINDEIYLRKKDKRPTLSTISTISTISDSVQSLDDIIFLPVHSSSMNDSSDV